MTDCPPADDTLSTWLLQQIEAAEASTRDLLYWAQQTILTLKDPKLLGKYIPGWHNWPKVERVCQERLAELAALRAVITEHRTEAGVCDTCFSVNAIDNPWDEREIDLCNNCTTIRLLAVPFAAEPGYRPEWRPQ